LASEYHVFDDDRVLKFLGELRDQTVDDRVEILCR
jgi:hypothetical protein